MWFKGEIALKNGELNFKIERFWVRIWRKCYQNRGPAENPWNGKNSPFKSNWKA